MLMDHVGYSGIIYSNFYLFNLENCLFVESEFFNRNWKASLASLNDFSKFFNNFVKFTLKIPIGIFKFWKQIALFYWSEKFQCSLWVYIDS